ncbi:MAG: hypothetical protein KAS32_00690 [Candidatus Peribacteraceae bacterium]|nr:hypothetical protein [Candidatus Peribacteraceae bacterium]
MKFNKRNKYHISVQELRERNTLTDIKTTIVNDIDFMRHHYIRRVINNLSDIKESLLIFLGVILFTVSTILYPLLAPLRVIFRVVRRRKVLKKMKLKSGAVWISKNELFDES